MSMCVHSRMTNVSYSRFRTRALMSWKVLAINVRAYQRIAMFSHGIIQFVVKTIFIINILLTITDSVKIEKLVVPEVVQRGNSSGAILDCIYTDVSDQFTLQWIINGREPPVYEWTPRSEPKVSGILEERLDLSYRPSGLPSEERRALRIVSLEPELSGDYTCRIIGQGTEARQTKYMLVYSPEKDLTLDFYRKNHEVDIKCTARGLYPQPEIILEHNSIMIPKQQLRMWRSEGMLYDAEDTALLTASSSDHKLEQITCRLHIPPAGYTAIKKEFVYLGRECGNSCSKPTMCSFRLLLMSLVVRGAFLQSAIIYTG